ncbi:MAG TPA: cysteine desulfurase-like protein [Gemmatimonadales bacterium]|jgi:cysteine desulfurase family protein (TIGR01976 family)|nr:cysteine desulfurase-like protein [Gemmatimonadales bacterium]
MTLAAAQGVAGVEAIRARFPALARKHRGLPVAYFDGPGGTQVPTEVVAAMDDYLYHHNANTHWTYPTSEETDRLIEDARAALADFLGARAFEIGFGLNMTTLTFHLARALGRGWSAGDEVIVTELDHHGNVAPWQALARERGIVLRTLPLRTEDGTLDLPGLPALLGPRTRLLAIGAASNVLGTVSDVAAACARAREAGALTFVDAVHAAPHGLTDVGAIGCDFLACSAYKFYGPHVGILWGRRERIEALDLPRLEPAPDSAPERLETGTQNHEGIVGAGAAVEFLAGLGSGTTRRARLASTFAELDRRSAELLRGLWEGLRLVKRVRLYGPPPGAPRTPTVSFTVQGMSAEAVARALAERGLFLSHGDFYAPTVLARLGTLEQGLVRAGCACYTTGGEVDRLIEAVGRLSR